jgi:hypothetical protein
MKPPNPEPTNIVELTLGDIDDAVETEYADIRRQQINYDARRRRYIRRSERLIAEDERIKQLKKALKNIEQDINAKWSIETNILWKTETFQTMKKERVAAMRRLRRKERFLEKEVKDLLGERPDIPDIDEGDALIRAVTRLGQRRLEQAGRANVDALN